MKMAITLDDLEGSCDQRDNQSHKIGQLINEISKNMHDICMEKLAIRTELELALLGTDFESQEREASLLFLLLRKR